MFTDDTQDDTQQPATVNEDIDEGDGDETMDEDDTSDTSDTTHKSRYRIWNKCFSIMTAFLKARTIHYEIGYGILCDQILWNDLLITYRISLM